MNLWIIFGGVFTSLMSYLWPLFSFIHTNTHPFNGPFSRTTRVAQYQKGKTNLDFTEVSGSGISWAICKSTSCSRQITMPALHHSVILQTGCPFCHPTNSAKALKAIIFLYSSVIIQYSVLAVRSGYRRSVVV